MAQLNKSHNRRVMGMDHKNNVIMINDLLKLRIFLGASL